MFPGSIDMAQCCKWVPSDLDQHSGCSLTSLFGIGVWGRERRSSFTSLSAQSCKAVSTKASANPVCNTWSTMAFGSGPALGVRWLRIHIPVSTSHQIWVTWGKVTLFIPGKIRGQQLMTSSVQYSVQGEEGSGQHLRFCYTHLKGNEVGGKARWVLCIWYW